MRELWRVEVLTRAGWHVRRHLTNVQVAKALNATKGQPTVEDVRVKPDPRLQALTEPHSGPYVDPDGGTT